MAPRWGGLRPEPFNPDAIDADRDGIVQEGTAFERPAGARLVDMMGNAFRAGMTSLQPIQGMRILDSDGNDIAYTPTWYGQLEEITPNLTSLQDLGIPTVGSMHPSLQDRGLGIADNRAMLNARRRETGFTVPQWAASGATPEDVAKGGIFYHASGEEVLGDLRSDGWGGHLHVGTLGAAGERAGMRRVDTEGTAVDNHVHEFSVTPKNPYLPNGVILRERDGARDSGLTNADIKRIIDDPDRQAELLAEGYDVIPYINAIEQEGSESYVILDPAAVTQNGGVGKATQTDVRGRGGAKIVEVDESNFVSAVPEEDDLITGLTPHGSASLKDRGLTLGDRGLLTIGERQDLAKENLLRSDKPTGDFGKPFMADDIDHALELIEDGHFVELQDPEQVNTLLDRLAEIAFDAKERGVEAPNYNLCTVSVAGTNIFCAEQFEHSKLDNLRSEMPQLGGNVVPGSPADRKLRAMIVDAERLGEEIPTEVDAAEEWMADLRSRGITVTPKRVKASELHASQKELIGGKVATMMANGENPEIPWSPDEGSIFVSRDGYVIDGHHRWAAVVGMDAADGVLVEELMNVIEVDLSIHEVLQDALEFTSDFGIASKAAK